MANTHTYVYTYVVDLPTGINEAVMKCADGYTIYISAALSMEGRARAYRHAMKHINSDDWNKFDVNQIEVDAHGQD